MTVAAAPDRPQLSIVLPAHNEIVLLGSTVANVLGALERRGLSHEVLILENGSSDGTLRLARTLAAQLDSVRVLHLPIGNYGAALHRGFLAARGDIVVNFDVDYYDIGFLDEALTRFEDPRVGIVLASKRAPGSADRRPLRRRLLTAAFTALLHHLVDLPVSDAHGMKAMRRDLLAPFVEQCRLRGSMFDVELVVRAARGGLVVQELPATVVERRPPRTGLVRRSLESLVGAVRLRLLFEREAASHPGELDGPKRTRAWVDAVRAQLRRRR
jgi:glycosyltransferase involved in cell wall biosynthesis